MKVFLLVLLSFALLITAKRDYYDILGVDKSATKV